MLPARQVAIIIQQVCLDAVVVLKMMPFPIFIPIPDIEIVRRPPIQSERRHGRARPAGGRRPHFRLPINTNYPIQIANRSCDSSDGASFPLPTKVFTLTPRDRFMLLACDGFWTVFDPQGAVARVQQLLAEGRELKGVTNLLINEAIRGERCTRGWFEWRFGAGSLMFGRTCANLPFHLDSLLAERRCKDNCTVLLLRFGGGGVKE